MPDRFQNSARILALAPCFLGAAIAPRATAAERPNVILIVTDDQGYGDISVHANPVLQTPRIDHLARDGIRFARFYATPVCAPTRAALLTGRYPYRTRVVDTYLGRAMMDPDEVTLAERLAAAGYRCAIAGKWHLGDCYPMRPQDQGFHETLVHRGGGIGQPADLPGGSSYFDPILLRDGKAEQRKGYVTDILADEAIRFVEANRARPFFLTLTFNAPHEPLEVPAADADAYRARDLSAVAPPFGTLDTEATARVYGMIRRIDDGVGRLLDRLDSLGITENTLVMFLTDNGPQQPRWNAGLRGLKGRVFEGGIRVPFVVRWPGHVPAGRVVADPAAVIDVVPTVLSACGLDTNSGPSLDGRSLWPLLSGEVEALPARPYVVQWHRGDVPEAGRACAVVAGRWKLAQPFGDDGAAFARRPDFLLFDLQVDPAERTDVAADHPEVVSSLRRTYEAWFRDVSATRGFDPPRIVLGADTAPDTTLTRQDWRGARAGWEANSLGFWEVEVLRPGRYRVLARFAPANSLRRLHVAFGGDERTLDVAPGIGQIAVDAFEPAPGPSRFEAALEPVHGATEQAIPVGIESAEIERIGDPSNGAS